MKSLISLLLILIFLDFSSAITFSHPIQRSGSVREQLLRNGKYQEFLVDQHKLKTGSQPFIDYSDDYYLLDVTLGTPPQKFVLSLDTASSFLWVLDVNCVSTNCHGNPRKATYDKSKSSTFKNGAGNFVAQFDGQPISGYLAKETVNLVGTGGLTIQNQDFGSATMVPDLYLRVPVDGVLGFGFSSMAVNGTNTPLDGLLPLLDQPIFTIWMDKKTGATQGQKAGLITYGGMDNVNCDGDPNYVPLSVKSYWGFNMDEFSVGAYFRSRREQVISDTGSGWIGAPTPVLTAIVKATGAKYDWTHEIYTIPCSQMTTQPDILFTINGINYPIKSADYIVDLGLGNDQCVLTFFAMASSSFGPSWVLGDTFIRAYCHIYDFGNQRIGFTNTHHSF